MSAPVHQVGGPLCCDHCRTELQIICPAGCSNEQALPARYDDRGGAPVMTIAEAREQLKAVTARVKADAIEARRTARADRIAARDREYFEQRAARKRERDAAREAKRSEKAAGLEAKRQEREAKREAIRLALESKKTARQRKREAKKARKERARAVRSATRSVGRVAVARKAGFAQGLREHRCVCGYLTRGNIAWALHRRKCEIFEEVAA